MFQVSFYDYIGKGDYMRIEIIRTKIAEIQESFELIGENLPDSLEGFTSLGLLKDGMYKRIEFSIENVFDICAIINTDLRLGIPRSDDDILIKKV